MGASTGVTSRLLCSSAFWMRRSISRMLSRYWSRRARSRARPRRPRPGGSARVGRACERAGTLVPDDATPRRRPQAPGPARRSAGTESRIVRAPRPSSPHPSRPRPGRCTGCAEPPPLPRARGARVSVSRLDGGDHALRPHLLPASQDQSQPGVCRAGHGGEAGERPDLARHLHALRSRLLRRRDLQARTDQQSIRPESVTHVSGINRHPCGRNGPEKLGSPGRIRTSDQPVNSRLLYR